MEFKENFEKYKLKELSDISSSKRIFASEYKEKGIPFYRSKEIIEKQSNKRISNKLFISKERYIEIKNKYGVPSCGDLLLTSVGTLGVPYLVKNEEFYFKDGNLTWFRNLKQINKSYLYYWFFSPEAKYQITSKQIGSTQKALTISNLNNFEILIPTRAIQEKIVTILKSLDSKIEINNKIISNLESQAQAIFKSWFVDFEPFQDGNFVESELGMIPEGWEVKPIGELLDFDIGGGRGKEKPQEKYLIPAYVIRGTDIPDSKFGYFNMDNYRYHTESNLKNRRLQVGDIIFESSGGSTNQDLGRMLMVTDELLNEYNNDVICASFCKLIRINDSSVRWFVYNLLEYSYRNKILTKYEVKSTGISNFSFTIFKDDFKIAVPDRKTIERYFNVTGNNINLSAKLGIQNTKLAELRDALLPKLMAGEIDVSDIKIEGEEVKNE